MLSTNRICREIKETWDGRRSEYVCEIIKLQSDQAILKYVLEQDYRVDQLELHRGWYTVAFFWTERPVVLYVWFQSIDQCRGYYFNIADQISIRNDKIRWRDLYLDMLVYPDGTYRFLDQEEIPATIPHEIQDYIDHSVQWLTINYQRIISECELQMKS